MHLKGVTAEDFVNYKTASMFLCACSCDLKCDRENGTTSCQNSALLHMPTMAIDDDILIRKYLDNPITQAIVIGGLEPFDQFWEIFDFIKKLRVDYHCNDTVVIYTGFTDEEIRLQIDALRDLGGVVVKFGRYRPGFEPHFDSVLGVNLASPNQYAKELE